MTTVMFAEHRSEDGKHVCMIQAAGHATGSQDMCSAVSALLWTLYAWAKNAEVDIDEDELCMESGRAVIKFTGDERAAEVYKAFLIGFLQLQQHDPQYIKVIEAGK